jgi:hypothetical protein
MRTLITIACWLILFQLPASALAQLQSPDTPAKADSATCNALFKKAKLCMAPPDLAQTELRVSIPHRVLRVQMVTLRPVWAPVA